MFVRVLHAAFLPFSDLGPCSGWSSCAARGQDEMTGLLGSSPRYWGLPLPERETAPVAIMCLLWTPPQLVDTVHPRVFGAAGSAWARGIVQIMCALWAERWRLCPKVRWSCWLCLRAAGGMPKELRCSALGSSPRCLGCGCDAARHRPGAHPRAVRGFYGVSVVCTWAGEVWFIPALLGLSLAAVLEEIMTGFIPALSWVGFSHVCEGRRWAHPRDFGGLLRAGILSARVAAHPRDFGGCGIQECSMMPYWGSSPRRRGWLVL